MSRNLSKRKLGSIFRARMVKVREREKSYQMRNALPRLRAM